MKIGSKIKALRKERGITQEQLADTLGVSFQAVSKWETGSALPDITMAPRLARYFNVSMDELFEFRQEEADVHAIVEEAYPFRESDPPRAREILEEGLTRYPDHEVLLNNLLYVLNYSEHPDETITVATRLIERTREADIRYDALRFLAYAYKAKGDVESAKEAIERIPEIYFTKLTEMAYLFEGAPKREAAEKQKWISFENLLQMMWKLAECYEAEGKVSQAIEETQRALQLSTVMNHRGYDGYVEFFHKQIARLQEKMRE